jgi:ADP-ribose pyrophosphatase YjhB (NUDIX family)
MTEAEAPEWLQWARELHQIGQTGLYYTQNEFDRQRFSRLMAMSAEMIDHQTGLGVEQVQAALSAQPGYVTPKVDVRGAIFKEDQLLMVQEVTDGCWSMPGGWADVNFPPSAMVEREVWEETGLRVKANRLVGIYEANHDREPIQVFHSYKVVFLCETISGDLTTSFETPNVGFFPLNKIPELSIYRTNMRIIQDAYSRHLDSTIPATFD